MSSFLIRGNRSGGDWESEGRKLVESANHGLSKAYHTLICIQLIAQCAVIWSTLTIFYGLDQGVVNNGCSKILSF